MFNLKLKNMDYNDSKNLIGNYKVPDLEVEFDVLAFSYLLNTSQPSGILIRSYSSTPTFDGITAFLRDLLSPYEISLGCLLFEFCSYGNLGVRNYFFHFALNLPNV